MSEFNISEEVNEDGDTIMSIHLSSNLIAGLSIDTYQSFNGDYWAESEIESISEHEGRELTYDDFEWTYNHEGILRDLAEASAESIVDQLATDGIILSVAVESTYSPREYNFTSDSYVACWEVNLSKLEAWAAETGFDAAAYVREYHESRSGFWSFVPGWLEREPEETTKWLMVDAYMRAEYDEERGFLAVSEAEWQAYSDNTDIKLIEQDGED